MKTNYTIIDAELAAVLDKGQFVLVDLEDNTVYDRESFEAKYKTTIEEFLEECELYAFESDKFETDYLKYPSAQLGYTIEVKSH